jgi:hypothetical protein
MTYDPNRPAPLDRPATTARSSTSGWMIGLAVVLILVIGAFFLWPDQTANVAGNVPATTGSTPARPNATSPAPASPPASGSTAPARTAPATPQ